MTLPATLGALNLAELVATPGSHGGLAGRPPAGGAGRQGVLGLREPTLVPLGHGQESLGDGVQQPLALAAFGQGTGGERGRSRRVTAELGEMATIERNHRGDVRQHAAGPADRRLERRLVRDR